METRVMEHRNTLVMPQANDCWYYVYFTPPAELVGLSELRR